jgi:hypothetical protein
MKKNNEWKFLRIKGDILKAVEKVMTETNRNITGAAAYLIANGYSVFLQEQEVISEMKRNTSTANK